MFHWGLQIQREKRLGKHENTRKHHKMVHTTPPFPLKQDLPHKDYQGPPYEVHTTKDMIPVESHYIFGERTSKDLKAEEKIKKRRKEDRR